jgi:hypothetical protein
METNVTSVLPIAHDWAKEYAELSAREAELAPEELEHAAIAAHVLGNDEQTVNLLDRAHRSYLQQVFPIRLRAVSSGSSSTSATAAKTPAQRVG